MAGKVAEEMSDFSDKAKRAFDGGRRASSRAMSPRGGEGGKKAAKFVVKEVREHPLRTLAIGAAVGAVVAAVIMLRNRSDDESGRSHAWGEVALLLERRGPRRPLCHLRRPRGFRRHSPRLLRRGKAPSSSTTGFRSARDARGAGHSCLYAGHHGLIHREAFDLATEHVQRLAQAVVGIFRAGRG